MKELKILVKGSIGNRNLGDDLLVYAVDQLLKKSGIKCVVYYQTKNNYFRYISDKNVYQPFHFKKFDVVLFAGGTQFASFKKKGLDFSSIISILLDNPVSLVKIFTSNLKRWLESFTLHYKTLILVGVGIGPFFENDRYYQSTILLLKQADLLIVRDELSVSICKENGIPYHHGSDLVYTLQHRSFPNIQIGERTHKIAIIIRDWEFSEEKGSFIQSLLQLPASYSLTYFSFCRNKDEISLKKILEKNNSASIEIWDPENDIEPFLDKLRGYDLFLTARYHGAIIASICHKPFISIGIEPKLEMIAKLFNMPVWEYPYSTNSLHLCIEQINSQYDLYVQSIRKQTRNEIIKAEAMTEILVSYLKFLT